jgi:uncharacterized membrane protein YfcA
VTTTDVLVVATVIAASAVVQLAAGFGFALASVPLLSIVLDPHRAVIVALGLATFTNGYQAVSGRRHTDGSVVVRMLAGAALGLPVGLLVYRWADETVLGVLVGVAVLAAVYVVARGIDLRHAGAGLDVAAGALSGALTTSVGTNGPPLVFVLQARHFDQDRFRATITSTFFVLDVVGVAAFAFTGEIDRDVLIAIAASLPGLAVGASIGIALRRHLDAERFRRLVLVVLVVAGVSSIATALLR